MAKDPAFLFYPGDYLRDTQCLSESVQVAYDRIMCEHMRNICVSQQQLNFFTKKLSQGEKEELLAVLTQVDGGFQIDWVVDSVTKRRAYSESRSKNREGKGIKNPKEHMKTYVEHMENEIEYEKEKEEVKEKGRGTGEGFIIPQMWEAWKSARPSYPADKLKDFEPLQKIGSFISDQQKIKWIPVGKEEMRQILTIWAELGRYIESDKFFSKYSLKQVETHIQSISQSYQQSKFKSPKDIKDESDRSVDEFFGR